MTEDSKTHFEDMVEELLKVRGPLTSKEIAKALAGENTLIVVMSPNEVEYNDDGTVTINVDEGDLRAVSDGAVEERLTKGWFFYQDDTGRWHLGSP